MALTRHPPEVTWGTPFPHRPRNRPPSLCVARGFAETARQSHAGLREAD